MNPSNNNMLVTTQFNNDSFHVVQQVYYHLEQLRNVYRHLDLIDRLGQQSLRMEYIEPYLMDIQNISFHLQNLVQLQYKIPFLQEMAPRIEQVVNGLNSIESKIDSFELKFKDVLGLMETNTKNLEDLYVEYESGLQCLMEQFKDELCRVHNSYLVQAKEYVDSVESNASSVKTAVPLLNKAVKLYDGSTKVISHLTASDSTTLAMFSGSEEDHSNALKAIKESEKYGNDESINRTRLKYKLVDNNVFNVLDANRERLTKEGNQ